MSDSLNSMIDDGIITRVDYNANPPHIEYTLSQLGEAMRPILKAMEEWGTFYKNNI